MNNKKNNTSWGSVADNYDLVVEDIDGYHKGVILPNIIRLLNLKKGEKILDLACGQGFFSGEFSMKGALVTGVDISPELISIAKRKYPAVDFFVSSAENLSFLESGFFDKITITLAIQNIENIKKVFDECYRVLKKDGELFIVMNHPAFRIPKKSFWGFDEEKNIQYRRIDSYLSETKERIDMNPGDKIDKKFTLSFHRSLQFYFKILKNSGFFVTNLEEWISNKVSQDGPRKKAEDRARKEFPIFMFIGTIKK